ncbi:hypothetical protein DXV76_10670 [Rhodobacteraceae bacterium CCMM004]|nr:hypothetical protein DXV76_10670 [Rhodobacteraceae bacterium CCMM004]
MVVAYPVTGARRDEIAAATLVHVARAAHRDLIVEAPGGALPPGANCRIRLKAGQGWSVAPFRLLRDYSVLDPFLTHLKSYGCYTYFFIGEPGWWAVKKNIGPGVRWGDLGPEAVVFRVAGRDVLACADLLFYRPDDHVCVIRGDYRGPACMDPPP